MKNKIQAGITLLFIVAGNAILAIGSAVFIVPNGLISGGVTGIALILRQFTGLSVDIGIILANTSLFTLGALVLGKKFAVTTLLSTVLYPTFFSLFSRIPFLQTLTTDTLMASIYAGIFVGAGIGLVIKVGASTGGMDIPPIIFNRKFGMSIPVMIYVCDTALLLFQVFYATSEQVLYGVMVVLITSIVMDKILIMGSKQTQVIIISPQYEAINAAIHAELDRGSTLLNAVTGHLKVEQQVVMTIVSNRQLSNLYATVASIDSTAFIVVSEVNEVRGRGFTLSKNATFPK